MRSLQAMRTRLSARDIWWGLVGAGLVAAAVWSANDSAIADTSKYTARWSWEWPKTDFSRTSIDFSEILSGGPPKDGIPAIDDPKFVAVNAAEDLVDSDPVIGVAINGEARAYPLEILIWHEIVNDELNGVPVSVTFCPLCNAGIVFDRRLDGVVLDFGTTGKLRNSDLVMYDRQTESWWQQFTGEAIVGQLTGKMLEMLPARMESFRRFAQRHPDGTVLVPTNAGMRSYGINPYAGYDSAQAPFLYRGSLPEGIEPMARVVAVGDAAWSLDLVKTEKIIEVDDLVIRWQPGQVSALDSSVISQGRDVGNVTVSAGSRARSRPSIQA